jgi:hypothetical protein
MKKLLIFIAITLLLEACSTRTDITKYSQITDNEPDKLIIFCKDSSLITLDKFSIKHDSLIMGSGSIEKNGIKEFDGEIKLSEINYLSGQSSSFFRGLVTTAMIGTVAVLLLVERNTNTGVGYELKFPTGSSCPFLYSSGENGYVLEGEAFGTGLGHGMETTTAIVLNNLDVRQSEMKVRFTNERPETHYFNCIEADAIVHDKNSEIVADNNEKYIPVYAENSPLSAIANGFNILAYIGQKDKKLWTEEISPSNGTMDTIYLTFNNSNKSLNGTLIVNAINTYFGTYTYYYINEILGRKYLEFMNCIETDNNLIKDLRDYLQESSLNIEVRNGEKWEYVGKIKPEANLTSFSKGIRFNIPEGTEDRLHLRIISLKDVWKIDNICCDFSRINELAVQNRQILKAVKNGHENIWSKVNYDDSNYCVLLPNDKLDIHFSPQAPVDGKKITYAIKTKGYLQPWQWENDRTGNSKILKIAEGKKIEFVKNILKNRNYFLPFIYSEWEKDRRLFGVPN